MSHAVPRLLACLFLVLGALPAPASVRGGFARPAEGSGTLVGDTLAGVLPDRGSAGLPPTGREYDDTRRLSPFDYDAQPVARTFDATREPGGRRAVLSGVN